MSHFITYLALDRPASVSADETITAFSALAGSAPMRIELAGQPNSTPGEAFVVLVNGSPVTVMFIGAPLPPDAWEEAAARSIVWRDAAETMRKTQAHVIVALLQDTQNHLAALSGAAAVTMVAGALARQLPVAATIFTEAQSIVKGGGIESMASGFAQGQVPDLLWTTLSLMRGPATPDGRVTTAALTIGLLPFVGREIEFEPAPLQPVEIAERLIGLCKYLILNGPIIKDGETVGLTEKEKIRVRYAAAGQRPGVPVMSMTLERHDPAAGHFAPQPSPAPISGFGAPTFSGQRPAVTFGKRRG